MINFDLSKTDPFDGQEFSMPPRCYLFSIAPMGVGTLQQESLTSLLIRTAYAHSISPRELVGKVFAVVEPSISKLAYSTFFIEYAGTINGLGRYAELFAATMEKLTGRVSLRHLTMLPWQGLFPPNGQGLLARHPRWCPECLSELYLQGGEIGIPLIWSMEAVQRCPEHRLLLEERCPHCRRRQPFIPRYPNPIECDYCHRLLFPGGSQDGSVAIQQSEFEGWIVKAVGAMLSKQSELGFAPTVEDFRAFIDRQVQVNMGGNRAAFCRTIGLRDDALNGWINKCKRPSMSQFLKVCYGIQTDPDVVFSEGEMEARASLLMLTGPLKKRASCPRLSATRRAELEAFLLARLGAETPPPVSAIARELGLTPHYLRYWFPDLCRQLTARYRAEARLQSAELCMRQVRRVKAIVTTLESAGVYPSFRKVNLLLRKEGMSLVLPHLDEAYRVATDKAVPIRQA